MSVTADRDGRYEVYLGAGRYRTINLDPIHNVDFLREGQPREVTMLPLLDDTVFDIELELAE